MSVCERFVDSLLVSRHVDVVDVQLALARVSEGEDEQEHHLLRIRWAVGNTHTRTSLPWT